MSDIGLIAGIGYRHVALRFNPPMAAAFSLRGSNGHRNYAAHSRAADGQGLTRGSTNRRRPSRAKVQANRGDPAGTWTLSPL